MKKEVLLKNLSDGIVLEETTVMTELSEIMALVNCADFPENQRNEIKEKIDFLVHDSAKHAGLVIGLIKKVNSSGRKDF